MTDGKSHSTCMSPHSQRAAPGQRRNVTRLPIQAFLQDEGFLPLMGNLSSEVLRPVRPPEAAYPGPLSPSPSSFPVLLTSFSSLLFSPHWHFPLSISCMSNPVLASVSRKTQTNSGAYGSETRDLHYPYKRLFPDDPK